MKPLNQLLSENKYRQNALPLKNNSSGWWTPLWKGLFTDAQSKHRKAMGASIWLYLYLLTFTNRRTGVFTRRQEIIARETGLPVRTVQRYLKRLATHKYITPEPAQRPLRLRIEKWKLFNSSKPS